METLNTTIRWIEDSGHAWLKVPKKLLSQEQVSRISTFSYESALYYYLEEDCDAQGFLKAANLQTHPIREINVDWHHGETWVRLSGEGFVSPFEHYER